MLDVNLITQYLQLFLEQWGVTFIFIISLIESIVLLGSYIPGTIIIFGVLATMHDNITIFLYSGFVASLGILAGYIIDFFIGKKYGNKIIQKLNLESYSNSIKQKIEKRGIWIIGFFFYLPGVSGGGSVASLILGSMNLSFKKFISLCIPLIIIWNIVWGSLIYFFGQVLVNNIIQFLPFIILSLLIIGFVYFKYKLYKDEQKIIKEEFEK